ncbi:MAG TPA: DISARM system helicase DrmA [Gemmataceae bacterium]|nr:DISARM system helicase DrmA [Gemmataceae bacterium]
MKPLDVRSQLVDALGLDLIGPDRDSELLAEVLPQAPSRWYLTGFLVPIDADESQKSDVTGAEGVEEASDAGGTDDATPPEPVAARRGIFPSSMGLSLLVPKDAKELRVTARWGDYRPLEEPHPSGSGEEAGGGPRRWQRTDRSESMTLRLPASQKPRETEVPGSGGLQVALSIRPVRDIPAFTSLVPKGTRSVSVFLVNRRKPAPDETRDTAFAFQAALEVKCDCGFVARPNLRGLDSADRDERVADLPYRDVCEHAVGHGIATRAVIDAEGRCAEVHTRWIPSAEVERVAPAQIEGVELGMEELARLPDGSAAKAKLSPLVAHYRAWIKKQRTQAPTNPKQRADTAADLLNQAGVAAGRIEDGIALLAGAQALEAFRLANRVMAIAARRREAQKSRDREGAEPQAVDAPSWRPFQLAFLLMNLRGMVEPAHPDREVVDLLFFPTGGGKTEAYLGLAAFTLVYRRLTHPGITSAGLSVLMRYTLRLLTLDQLARAAALICALELERQQDVTKLGEWPFEIGLWVGRAATPNEMGRKGDNNTNSARARTIRYKNNSQKAAPIPLEECPWCGTKFAPNSFNLLPNPDQPTDLRITCVNRACDFSRNNPLPILAVDEPIYRRLPCFLIATVDKFAALPWTGPVGGFFGRVDRHDKHGFYGPCAPGVGVPLPAPLPPPDLVIQDELHLISGPMGTMVGLYESALDELCARRSGFQPDTPCQAGSLTYGIIRPKIVASTATVRRAERQIRALFCRRAVDIFPPPGPDRRDSFFARTHSPQESHARLYLGVAAQGQSLKKVLLRTYLALLGAAQKWYTAAGGKKNKDNPADPYMTLLGYFNSLRELGGSRRIIEDEVSTQATARSQRRREGEADGLFADRKIAYEVLELTSRVSTDKVAEAKRRLDLRFHDEERVDVAIATNMISVGLDITRLGLMVVLGQPKASAEYIQATSRIGRDPGRPGLVVTILNVHRPRDRSHYERFAFYHGSFYRSVEATSVTPFSPRALDRGLAGTLVGLARQGHAPMTPPKGAGAVLSERGRLDWVAKALARRAADLGSTPEESESLRHRLLERANDLLDEWDKIAKEYHDLGVGLQYQQEEGGARRLLYEFLHPELKSLPLRHRKFRANRSMRDVEPSVNLWVKTLDNIDIEDEE